MPSNGRWAQDGDEIYLEDESGRVALMGPLLASYVSGIVAAVVGHEIAGGEFVVEDICCGSWAPQKPLASRVTANKDKRYAMNSNAPSEVVSCPF